MSRNLYQLPPDEMAEVVRVFGAALRQAREEETELLWLRVYELELLCDEMATLNAELRRENAAASAHYPAAPNK
jgi:hypothetical protein